MERSNYWNNREVSEIERNNHISMIINYVHTMPLQELKRYALEYITFIDKQQAPRTSMLASYFRSNEEFKGLSSSQTMEYMEIFASELMYMVYKYFVLFVGKGNHNDKRLGQFIKDGENNG